MRSRVKWVEGAGPKWPAAVARPLADEWAVEDMGAVVVG
jgi:hypothetical protein